MSRISQAQRTFKRFTKHRLGLTGGLILLIMYLLITFANFFAPYPYDLQSRGSSFHPPTRLHFFDADGNFHWRPFIYGFKQERDPETLERTFVQVESVRHQVRFLVQGKPYKFCWFLPMQVRLLGVDSPGRLYLCGADIYGRDIFSRLLYGGRVSLTIGLVGVAISFTLGLIIGGISGYFGGLVDIILMRLAELVMSFPGFYLLLTLRVIIPSTLSSTAVFFLIVIILSFIGWASLARIIRGMVLSIKEEEYVLGAKAIGASHGRIIIRHLLPNTLSYCLVAATLSIPGYILGESALSLLGLGINEPQASWGNMLAEARNIQNMVTAPWILTPGVLIFIAIMAFNFLGDGLRDAFDPKAKFIKTRI